MCFNCHFKLFTRYFVYFYTLLCLFLRVTLFIFTRHFVSPWVSFPSLCLPGVSLLSLRYLICRHAVDQSIPFIPFYFHEVRVMPPLSFLTLIIGGFSIFCLFVFFFLGEFSSGLIKFVDLFKDRFSDGLVFSIPFILWLLLRHAGTISRFFACLFCRGRWRKANIRKMMPHPLRRSSLPRFVVLFVSWPFGINPLKSVIFVGSH